MPHTMTTDSSHPAVSVPWVPKNDMPKELVVNAYETCRRGDKGHCINTQYVRACAVFLEREIRSPGTYKGAFHWSEKVEGWGWCMFIAPLSMRYARLIDGFDENLQHFRAPAKCPMGPVRFAGFCRERRDVRAAREERGDRLNARISNGMLVPGARFREPQTPYVQAQSGK